jgi:hypothetical protein
MGRLLKTQFYITIGAIIPSIIILFIFWGSQPTFGSFLLAIVMLSFSNFIPFYLASLVTAWIAIRLFGKQEYRWLKFFLSFSLVMFCCIAPFLLIEIFYSKHEFSFYLDRFRLFGLFLPFACLLNYLNDLKYEQ